MSDRVLELRRQIQNEMKNFDAAAARRDEEAATRHADRARYLDELYASAVPNSPMGAADKIRDAVTILRAGEDDLRAYYARNLNPIAKRLARGDRRLADIMTLRAIVSLVERRQSEDDVFLVLSTALKAVSRPVALSSTTAQ